MMTQAFSLNEPSIIQWHNLLKNPDDLPNYLRPLTHLIVLAFDEDIIDQDRVMSFGVVEACFFPETKEWKTLIDEDTDPESDKDDAPKTDKIPTVKEISTYKYMYKKPAARVIAWAFHPMLKQISVPFTV